jgi:hypothetical protein
MAIMMSKTEAAIRLHLAQALRAYGIDTPFIVETQYDIERMQLHIRITNGVFTLQPHWHLDDVDLMTDPAESINAIAALIAADARVEIAEPL